MTLLLKEQHSARSICFSKNFIDVEVLENVVRWGLTGFYGHAERHKKRLSWQLLKALKNRSPLPWCCIVEDVADIIQTNKAHSYQ